MDFQNKKNSQTDRLLFVYFVPLDFLQSTCFAWRGL